MNGIEYELNSSDENFDKNLSWKESLTRLKDDEAVNFSVKVIEALEKKMREHNSASSNKVSLKQLKKVYRRAAGNVFADVPEVNDNKGKWAMARVNMYLRILNGEPLPRETHATVNFDYIEKDIDLIDAVIPTKEDFLKASEDIERFNLDYKFDNISDLYLDDEDNASFAYFID
tara:strand:+ start:682 stop:1203 length:522 start_codon:yes stop_codon:yes gene_type:complete